MQLFLFSDQNTPQQEYYHRQYNRRVQNNNYNNYVPRENRRYNYQTYQPPPPPQQQQPETDKPIQEEPFVKYSPIQSKQKLVQTTIETRPTQKITEKIIESKITKEITSPALETSKVATIDKENVFEPREEDDEEIKKAKAKHWDRIINNVKSSLGITEEPESETLPDYVLKDHAEIAKIFFTESPEDLEAKKYGITLIHNSEESENSVTVGFDWKAEEQKARESKSTKDWLQLYKEYKDKYEFPDYLSEKRRIERAEYKAKKKILYKGEYSFS